MNEHFFIRAIGIGQWYHPFNKVTKLHFLKVIVELFKVLLGFINGDVTAPTRTPAANQRVFESQVVGEDRLELTCKRDIFAVVPGDILDNFAGLLSAGLLRLHLN